MTSRWRRSARALGALIVLLSVVAGVPSLLTVWDLVPHALPSVYEVRQALTARDDGQLVRAVLVAGAWVCWAVFTAATAAEIVGAVSARSVRPLPGLRVFQQPAAALVAAIALGLALAPAGVALYASGTPVDRPPLPAVSAAEVGVHSSALPEHRSSTPASSLASDEDQLVHPIYVVQRRDTLWALADRHLGDPLRYAEIVELNPGVVGHDNRIATGAALVMPVDAVELPVAVSGAPPEVPAPSTDVIVEPGDTLWGISAEATGDGRAWGAVWAANQGRVETGGEVFDDPDLIRPGWSLTVPVAAGAVVSTAPVPPVPAPSVVPAPSPEPVPPVEPAPPAQPTVIAAPVTQGPSNPTSTSSASGTAPTPGAADSASSALPAATALTGTLLAGVSLLALMRYRRQQFRRRRPGQVIGNTPVRLIPVERAMVMTGTVDVSWLDRALRSLGQNIAPLKGGSLPDVLAVCLSDDVLTLVLGEPMPQAPVPWTVDDSGARWSIHRDDPLAYDESQRGRAVAPFPTLASIGYTDRGEQWLIDLERVGLLRISGDADRGADLLRFLAAELAHNTWSEMLRVTAVGVGPELATLNPDRLACTEDVDAAIGDVIRRQAAVLKDVDASETDVLDGRLHDVGTDAWAPHVLLLGPDTGGGRQFSQPLTKLRRGALRTGVAVVLVDRGDVVTDVEWQMDIDSSGRLRVPLLGLDLQAHQLSKQEAGPLAQVLCLAAGEAGEAAHSVPADREEDGVTGAIGRATGGRMAGDASPLGTGAVAEAPSSSVLPVSCETYPVLAATTERDLQSLPPAAEGGVRLRAERLDPDLDRDLEDWVAQDSPRPKISLLGSVRVSAQGKLPERNPRRQFYTEVAVYLATRPDGVTSERFATSIWPNEPDVVGKTKVRQAISVVRTWMGADPQTGADYLPSGLTAAAAGRYRVIGALIDADLFRRLQSRGLAHGRDGIADLETALGLVNGRPFDLPTPRTSNAGGYSWLVDADSRLDHEYAAMIVDVAHTVATHHLEGGDARRAADAAKVALRSGTFEDVPLLDLVAACDLLGNKAEADSYVARILANHDAEVEEDLPPRTAAILHRRERQGTTNNPRQHFS